MVRTSKRITISNDNRVNLAFDDYDNTITINGVDYILRNLSEKGSRGGNSNVFKMVLAEEEDGNYDDDTPLEFIIKISNIPNNIPYSWFTHNRRRRFEREIIALRIAEKNNLLNVVRIIDDGQIMIGSKEFNFYTMEKGSSDLTDYLQVRKTIQQKIFLFISILQGIKQLHNLRIYHRDIKHDNIFMFGEECKVGDLGLMRFKKEDNLALDNNQRLGAFGWESPEAMNKFLTENDPNAEFTFDCIIDESSDIFQLGKLFWYILQGNLPIGCLQPADLRIVDEELFAVLSTLLQHRKNGNGVVNRRPANIQAVELLIQPIAQKYGVV